MPYQTNGVNYQTPGFSPYYAPYVFTNNPGIPTYMPNTVPANVPQMQPQQGYSAPAPQFVPTPVPAYTVANPYAGFGYGCCGTAQTCCC